MSSATHKRKHKHAPQQHAVVHSEKRKPGYHASVLMAIFIGLVGLAIGAYSTGSFTLTAIITLIAVIAGALIGHGIDRSIAKK